jgi:hypothetical protein
MIDTPKLTDALEGDSCPPTCSASLRVPVTLWAEIGDDRIEREYFVTIPLPEGHCPELAKSLALKATAQHLHGIMIKTGVSFLPNSEI